MRETVGRSSVTTSRAKRMKFPRTSRHWPGRIKKKKTPAGLLRRGALNPRKQPQLGRQGRRNGLKFPGTGKVLGKPFPGQSEARGQNFGYRSVALRCGHGVRG